MGGQYQAMGHAYFLSNFLELGLDIQEAIDLPRLFPTLRGPVEVEGGVPTPVVQELVRLGHKTARPEKPIGGGQAIWIDPKTGVLTAGSDPRKDGCAMGY
jgi:gamma-glutamyltranspeptidase/glutathione hydrolase